MRAPLALVFVGLTAAVTAHEPQRYLVIPAGHHVDLVRPCRPSLSADGLVIAFDALAPLDPADTNGRSDVYVLDRPTRALTLASRGLSGTSGRGSSRCPSVSGDGQRLVFESDAHDLVEGDTPGTSDVFFFDRKAGGLRRLSHLQGSGPQMAAHPAISSDGRVAVFHARPVDAPQAQPTRVYRATLDTGDAPAPLADGHSPSVSGDGRRIAYVSRPQAGGPSVVHVTGPDVTDLVVGQTQGAPADGDASAPELSADGRWIAYVSKATHLMPGRRLSGRAHVYLERLDTGLRRLISAAADGREANGYSDMPSIDESGSRVVFEGSATNIGCGPPGRLDCRKDINLLPDVFLWDASTGEVARVNVPTPDLPWLEGAAYPAMSADGRVVAFHSRQPVSEADDRNTYDLFVMQR